MAEGSFDSRRFELTLGTRRLGRSLVTRAEVGSTNDAAWEALGSGAPHGTVVVADAQTQGRGREGRSWHTAPGRGLALSLLLTEDSGSGSPQLLPLAAGLALSQALGHSGVRAELKWPNDLLIGRRKLAGILCESRGGVGERAVVIGVGVNVSQRREDFPHELVENAELPPPTSLALEGSGVDREAVAAGFLNELEPLLETLAREGAMPLLSAWRARAAFWGQTVRVRTPAGPVVGIAESLDRSGALVLALADGRRVSVMAGDLELAATPAPDGQ